MTRPARVQRRRGERGAATIAVALGAGVALLLVVQLVNVMVFQWGQGVVRAALDEGVRVGARNGDEAACEARANATINDLAAGMADGVTVSCVVDGRSMTATATVSWDGWLAGVADHNSTVAAAAALEDR